MPGLWSEKLMKEMAKTMGLANILREMSRPEADPLSKAIIVEGLTELSTRYPNRHMTGILQDIVKMTGEEDDYELAEKITLACCSQSENTSDSSSESSRECLKVRVNPHLPKP